MVSEKKPYAEYKDAVSWKIVPGPMGGNGFALESVYQPGYILKRDLWSIFEDTEVFMLWTVRKEDIENDSDEEKKSAVFY